MVFPIPINPMSPLSSSFRDIRSDISFRFHFSMNFLSANSKAPDETPRSHLGLHCLPMSHNRTLGLYGLMEKLLRTQIRKSIEIFQ